MIIQIPKSNMQVGWSSHKFQNLNLIILGNPYTPSSIVYKFREFMYPYFISHSHAP